jgi:WD40 repeat protein
MDDAYDFSTAPAKSSSSGGGSGSKSKKTGGRPAAEAPAAAIPVAERKAVTKAPTPKKAAVEEDEYGDDFEDYNDDFEDADVSEPPVVVNQAKLVASRPPAPAPVPAPAPAPAPPKTMSSDSSQQRKKSSGDSSASASASSLGSEERKKSALQKVNFSLSLPKGSSATSRRLQRLHASNVMDLQLEKTVLTLNLPSSSGIDFYYRQLRTAPPLIKQVGCPSEEERREMDVQTDDVDTASQEVQFCYGDDADFCRAMEAAARRRKTGSSSASPAPASSSSSSSTAATTTDALFSSSGTRLSAFVQSAASLMEALLTESEGHKHGSSSSSGRNNSGSREGAKGNPSLFPSPSAGAWQTLGSDTSAGANELLRSRRTSAVVFSPQSPHLLACVHPIPAVGSVEEAEDLRPGKGLLSMWDAYAPGLPLFLLQTPGDPTCVSFSASQANLLLAGSAEGSLHLWDLSEPAELHHDQDSLDLKIARGIRRPCFSTPVDVSPVDASAFSAASDGGSSSSRGRRGGEMGGDIGLSSQQHASAVTAVHPLPSAGPQSTLSQWCSLDLLGTAVLWVTSAASGLSVASVPGLAPWGGVALSPIKVLQTHGSSPSLSAGFCPLLSTVPGDPGQFLVSAPRGRVRRVWRFGGDGDKEVGLFSRATVHVSSESGAGEYAGGGSTEFNASVSCLAAGPLLQPSESTEHRNPLQLFLAGRLDGSVDVFDMKYRTPLRSYSLHVLREEWEHAQRTTPPRKGEDPSRASGAAAGKASAVVFVSWLPQRPHAFITCTADGTTYVIDLLLGGLQAVDSLSSPAGAGGLAGGAESVNVKAGCIALSLPVVPSSRSPQSRTAAASHLAVSARSFSSSAASTCLQPIWDGWNLPLHDRPRLLLERSDVGFRSLAAPAVNGAQAEEEIEAALRRALFELADTGAEGLTNTIIDRGVEGQRERK